MSECTCEKRRYYSRREAKRVAREIQGRGAGPKMRAYRCGGFWHLTSATVKDTVYFRRRS